MNRSSGGEFVAESGGRMKGICVVKPIVYGNSARYFGKKREEDGHTHSWTVYLKPYHNEDISVYVKKIQFKLHESYANPLRVVTKPPYEVTETGWGQFDVVIKVFFHDTGERPLTIYHPLRLFQTESNLILSKKTVVSESYDEMIFQDPSVMMHSLLTSCRQLTLGAHKHETDFEEKERQTVKQLTAAKQKIQVEIKDLKERLKQSRDNIKSFREEIKKLEREQDNSEMT
uniref:YEATS domain-containing protein 4 n=1 Tax=Phallusia mammillata TaxID=59560 RepID=A0A6F9DWM7_9ASCI|nr:YEATS domain-containing protein 4-like [Phallusia mammillata]